MDILGFDCFNLFWKFNEEKLLKSDISELDLLIQGFSIWFILRFEQSHSQISYIPNIDPVLCLLSEKIPYFSIYPLYPLLQSLESFLQPCGIKELFQLFIEYFDLLSELSRIVSTINI